MELDSFADVSLMAFHNPGDLTAKRQRAAQLLEAVLDERIEPRIAINRWPESDDRPDLSLNCAYRALWHFEADEDKQKSELFYMDAQLELLRQMAGFLKAGKALPPYILRMYSPSQPIRFFYPRSWLEENQHMLCRNWHAFMAYWQQIWRLCIPSEH